jgi:DNA-binding helix-turn-helix protein
MSLVIFIGGDVMNELKKLNKKRVAQNVGRLIAESNMPNEEIAFQLDITPRLLYYWQTGKRVPNTENVYGLSQLFKVSMESILI